MEKLVLADATQRVAQDCDGKARQCALSIRADRAGAVDVFVEYATVLGEDCGYMPGDHELIRYDAKGQLLERVPGI